MFAVVYPNTLEHFSVFFCVSAFVIYVQIVYHITPVQLVSQTAVSTQPCREQLEKPHSVRVAGCMRGTITGSTCHTPLALHPFNIRDISDRVLLCYTFSPTFYTT